MRSDFDLSEWILQLRATVLRLAQAPEDQLAYLRALGLVGSVDELAFEFDDLYTPLRWRLVEVVSMHALVGSLDAIEVALKELDELGPQVWTDEALVQRQEWQELRHVAKCASQCFPDL